MTELDQKECDLYEVRRRLENAERILRIFGYERCAAAACNCSSYHKDFYAPKQPDGKEPQ